MESVKKFAKSSLVYFIGNVLTRGISFLLLPLYTNYIVQEDMGYYDLSVSYLNILIPVICMEIWSGIMRYMFDSKEKSEKYKVIFNGMAIFAVSVALYCILFLALGVLTDIEYLLFIFVYGLLTMIQYVYTYIARGLGFNTAFAVSGLVGSLINAISNIVMILLLGMQLSSLYLAMIFGFIVQIVILESKVHLFRNVSFKMLDIQLLKSMAKFSLPLCLNSACYWFLSSYNRIGISNVLGLEMNGIYSVAAKFAFILSLVSSCFSMAWQELVYSKGNDPDKSVLYTTASNYYIQFLGVGLLLFLPAIRVVFPVFVGEGYHEAFTFIPLYLLGTAASVFSGFLGNIFGAEKRTAIVLVSTLAAAAVNVSLFHLLVGSFGVQAANISLLCGFLVNIVMRMFLINQTSKVKLNIRVLIFIAMLFSLACYVYLYQGIIINILFAVVVLVLCAIHFRLQIKAIMKTISRRV